MITKTEFVDKIEALMESGILQIRTVTRVVEDGVVLAEKFHRHTIAPDQDYSTEAPEVQAACAAMFTPERVAAYKAAQAAAQGA